MLSVRNVVLAAAALLAIAIIASLINMAGEPDSGGMGNDSYGTRGYGYRALFEMLDEFDVPVSRGFAPPDADQLSSGTLVFLKPNPMVVATEPTYLAALNQWVESGGRIVVAPDSSHNPMMQMSLAQLESPPVDILNALGLEGVAVVGGGFARRTIGARRRPSQSERNAESIAEEMLDAFNAPLPPLQEVNVSVEGDFASIADDVRRLSLPADAVVTLFSDQPPDGRLTYNVGGEPATLAARFKRGAGEIIVVADPLLLTNRALARSDNSVLAARLLTAHGEAITFDEFYHGLGVRGQPLYLLTRISFAAVTIAILLTLGLYIWRRAIIPGPPLADDKMNRRDIREYVSAMAAFFSQGGRGHAELVKELRNGVLRQVSVEAGLPPDTADVDRIVAAVARKDIQRSRILLNATHSVDEALQSQRRWSKSETLDAMRRITACL